MAQSEPRSDAQDVVNLPRLMWEPRGGGEGEGAGSLHVHVYLPGKATKSGRSLLTLTGGGAALVVAFLAGAITAGGPARSPSQAEFAALQTLAGIPALPASPQGAQGSMPLLPPSGGAQGLPPHLQQMLAQPPRVQPPPGATVAAQPGGSAGPGTPASTPAVQGTPTRNAFGLEN